MLDKFEGQILGNANGGRRADVTPAEKQPPAQTKADPPKSSSPSGASGTPLPAVVVLLLLGTPPTIGMTALGTGGMGKPGAGKPGIAAGGIMPKPADTGMPGIGMPGIGKPGIGKPGIGSASPAPYAIGGGIMLAAA